MNRTLAVARIHLMDRANALIVPWIVLAASFTVNVILWMLIPEAGPNGSGGIISLYALGVAMIVVLVGRGLPFQLGLGVTRREFLGGTVLLVAGFSLACAIALTGLNFLERATDGFGLQGHFFRAPWFTAVPDGQLVAIYALPMVFFLGVGMLYAALWSRYKLVGSVTLTVALAFVVVGLIAVITWRDGWPGVGHWFTTLAPLPAVGILGALGAVSIAGAWLTLRRAPV